ncbi:hypothetical protein MSG28_011492 [Choristoneura fumiferana]|uniref:Uncharacterized protein n=1 Tax=Choristoneura fumiferana TaxID=7141 RepID=A0ACC0JNM0_CHOFU|nr:hypothetical protein MSG28_011492 [Choristoneura fumiferana]
MDSEDDIHPLIDDEIVYPEISRDLYLELNTQEIHTDPEYEQVVYGYRRSRWRTNLVYAFSVLLCGVPLLLFHWSPTWFLYATCVRACFQLADQVLVVETYQKKCKTFYIHKIIEKTIADTSGLFNEGFTEGDEKVTLTKGGDLHTPLHLDDGTTLNVDHYRYFKHKKQFLVWDGAHALWALLAGVESGATCAQLHGMAATPPSGEKRARIAGFLFAQRLSLAVQRGNAASVLGTIPRAALPLEEEARFSSFYVLNIYGLNEIKVPVQSVLTLVLLEVVNPFYVFQVFTIAVWLAEPYYYYCGAVVLMSTFGVATSVIQTKKNQESLRATVEAHASVQLWDSREVDSRCVAPGDVITLPPHGCVMLCDCVLLAGSAIVNESMLTGESVPVSKTALLRTDKAFDLKEHASSVLFCGTRVIQTRYYNNEPVRALVLRTGYNTSKGQLVRSILYPTPADFKFDRDSYKFIVILACIAVLGLAYTVALKAYRNLTPGDIAIKALDIITIVVPPALPAAMTVGRLYAVARLKRARVACLNTRAVNVSGSLDCICFDKTGTLTEDGMDMWGVVPAAATRPARLARALRDPRQLNDLHELKLGMASCHSLTLLNGELAGDPLDLKMFESTGWSLEEPAVPEPANYEMLTPTIVRPRRSASIDVDDVHIPLEVGIVQQHQFVSSLQRASVVVRLLGEQVLRAYCKGAPEMIRSLSRPETGTRRTRAERGAADLVGDATTDPLCVPMKLVQAAAKTLRVMGLHNMSEVPGEQELIGGRPTQRGDATRKPLCDLIKLMQAAAKTLRVMGLHKLLDKFIGIEPLCDPIKLMQADAKRLHVMGLHMLLDKRTGTDRGAADQAGDATTEPLCDPIKLMQAAAKILHGKGVNNLTNKKLENPRLLPEDLDEVLHFYAEKGYRVIALGSRLLEVTHRQLQKMTREEVECELEFLGLVIMENKLKGATTNIIRELKEANIHVVMITAYSSPLLDIGLPQRAPLRPVLGETHPASTSSLSQIVTPPGALHYVCQDATHAHLWRKPSLMQVFTNHHKVHHVWRVGDNIHTAVSVAKECGILAGGERVVQLCVETSGLVPVVCADSTFQGVAVGRRTALQRSWRSLDSGRGSSARSEKDAEAPPAGPNYKVVMTGDTWKVIYVLESKGAATCSRSSLDCNDNSGHVLREHYPAQVPRVIGRGAVFARMTSDQKQQLVTEYQHLGYYVGMCGDGANDCGALRAAHTGISLSELESSVAAPFTSSDPDIVCVARVLREGRAALTTSFGVFKFMVAYSLTEFLSVAFLYYFDSNLTDFQFLYIDVALIVNFAFFFGMTEAYTGKLCKIPPLTSLLGLVPLTSLVGQLVLIGVAQYLSYYALTFFPWYERHTYEGEEANKCWENYAIFAVSMFQYIVMPIVFSHGAPYRRSVVTNKQLMISILIMTGISLYVAVAPAEWLVNFLELKMPLDVLLTYIIIAIAAFHFVLAVFFERVIVQYLMESKQIVPKCLKEKRVRKTPHLMIKRELTDMDYLEYDSEMKYESEATSSRNSSKAPQYCLGLNPSPFFTNTCTAAWNRSPCHSPIERTAAAYWPWRPYFLQPLSSTGDLRFGL